MPTYRLYRVSDFDRVGDPIEISAASDDEAMTKAAPYVDGTDVMLWDGPCFVMTLKRKPDGP